MKRYAVDVHLDFARSYIVDASSRNEAVAYVEKMISTPGFDPLTDGFERTDDRDIYCSGEENEDCSMEYF